MRLFIAVDVPEEIRDYLLEVQNKIDNSLAKFILTRSFHLTLKFLGEVSDDKLEEIKNSLNNIKFEPFMLKLDSMGMFPSENYIRVVWVGLEPHDKINELQQKIDNSLLKLFKKENKFHPHLTLARVKFVKDKKKFIENLKDIGIDKKQFEINSFRLYKSMLTPEGPVYKIFAEFKTQVL